MAERRMFSKRLISSSRFMKMPVSSRELYFHLGLNADDDGVVEAWNVLQITGASEDDLRVLMAKGFIVVLNEDLVSYITDWREHNKIRSDRKIDSIYKNLLLQIVPDAEPQEPKPRADTGKLTGGQMVDGQWTSNGQAMDGQWTTQVRLVKERLGEVRIGQDSLGEDRSSTTTEQEQDLSTGEKVKALVKKYWKRDLVYDDALHYLSKVLTDGAEDSNKMQMLEIALKLSAAHGEKACNWAYVNAIYDGWRERNITTPEEWAAYEQSRKDGAR